MEKAIKPISITNLLLNIDNPRFDSTANQRESLDMMVSQLDRKLLALVEDIVEAGINPSELVMVTPDKGKKFKVLEGNRRVAALKLLASPNILKDKHKAFTNKLKKYLPKWKANKITAINCVTFSDEKEANRWIKLRHTGENNGKGVVAWDVLQVGRFDSKVEGKERIGLQALSFLQKFDDSGIEENIGKVSITNLERLLSDKYVQSVLGVKINNGILESDLLCEEVKKGLLKVVDDLVNRKINVKDIYLKEHRENYIETHFKRKDIPDDTKQAENTWQLSSVVQPDKKKQKKQKKERPSARNKLIPLRCTLSIDDVRINYIYHELKKLNVNDFKNAVSVLMRVFIELSADAFIVKFRLPKKNTKGRDLSLSAKLKNIADYMSQYGIAQKAELEGIRTATQGRYNPLSIDSLNGYIHNKHFSPSIDTLITTWDNIQIFMEKIWSNV